MLAYYRVSTDKQGESGLGLEAQQIAVESYKRINNLAMTRQYTEIESGKRNDRPELARALAHARRTGAVLVVAKLDRLARNARFLLGIVESGADVVFCDLPQIPPGAVGKFILTQMAAVAELEAGLISQRTKDALARVKARGGKLGAANPLCRKLTAELSARGRASAARLRRRQAVDAYADLSAQLQELRAAGLSLARIAEALNAEGHTTRRGKCWSAEQVRRALLYAAKKN
jgi:DNA invertase Pin-like site-specific DNA recombinase